MDTDNKLYREQAAGIAALADAIATGTLIGPRHAAVARLAQMVSTLEAWTDDDRSLAQELVHCVDCGVAITPDSESVGLTTRQCRGGRGHHAAAS